MEKSQLLKTIIKITDDRDEMAFSSLFDFLAPKLKAFYLQNGLSSEHAEELTQDVMSIVWSKADKYDPNKSAFSTWVYTVARNKKIDFLRKNSNIKVNEDDIREFLYENHDITQEIQKDAINQVKKINKELSLEQRKMIKMSFFENKSHKKIAQELEIPLGTVKSRIRHILLKLQKIL